VGAGIGAVTAAAGFGGRVRALRGAVDAGFSSVRGAALLLLFAVAVGFATLLFAVAGFAGVLGGILVVAFTDAFALVDGRAVFAALRAGTLVLAFFITWLRLTEFSGKGNPSVEQGWILHRILVDGASIG
jgi:phosphotransferase system  glucose/maltose/N-acetylglucosamine-specific IIC component